MDHLAPGRELGLGASGGDLVGVELRAGEEAHRGILREDLGEAGGEGHGDEEEQRHDGDEKVARLAHLDEQGRAETEGDHGEELVGDAEERPEGVDPAHGVDHAHVEEIAPGRDEEAAAEGVRPEVARVAERFPQSPEEVLQNEATHPRARVDRGEDEERLEHDREVVPEGHPLLAEGLREHVGHAHGEGRRSAGAAEHRLLADVGGERVHLRHGDGESGRGDDLDDLLGSHRLVDARVDREILAGGEGAGGDEGHQGDDHLGDHRAVGDAADAALPVEQLRRGARGDEGVEAGDRAAGDGDEDEGEDLAREDEAGAVGELRQLRHLQLRRDEDDGDGEGGDRADLHEGAEVVARGEEQPDGKDRGGEAVEDEGPGDPLAGLVEPVLDAPVGEVAAGPDAGEQADDAEDGHTLDADFEDGVGQAHDEGEGDGHGDGEEAPGALRECLHHDEAEHREKDRHDREDGDHRDDADDGVHLLLQHLPEGAPAAADRAEHDDGVMHAPAERRADEEPEHPRQVAELRREDRADERAGAGDGGEVVSEDDPAVCRDEVLSVLLRHRGGSAPVVEDEDLGHEPLAVEAIGDGERAEPRDDEPEGVDGLPLVEGGECHRSRAERGDAEPEENAQKPFHRAILE